MPEKDQIWEYVLTGRLYVIVQLCMVKMNLPGTENGWSKAVMYRAINETPLQCSDYVRELNEFQNKFVRVD